MQPSRAALILAGLFAGLLLTAPVWADPKDTDYDDDHPSMGMTPHHGDKSGMTGPMSVDRLKERLSLSDEQTGKLKELRRNYMKETLTLGTKIKIAELELEDAMDEKQLSISAIEKKARELEALRSDLTVQRVRFLLKAGEFLTPEQFETFRSMTTRRMEMGGSHPSTMRKGKDGDSPSPDSPHGGRGMSPGPGHPPTTPGTANPHQ